MTAKWHFDEAILTPQFAAEGYPCPSLSLSQVYFDPLAGRPVLITSRRRTAATNDASLSFARLVTAARRISLFFADTPTFRQRFLSAAIRAYSPSGMVKLSRTSLAFFTLADLTSFPLATKGSGTCVAFFAGGDFLATGRATVFFAAGSVALAVAGARFLAGFVTAGAAALVALGRVAGLGADGLALAAVMAVLAAGVAATVSTGLLVSSAMVNLLFHINRINSICSLFGYSSRLFLS